MHAPEIVANLSLIYRLAGVFRYNTTRGWLTLLVTEASLGISSCAVVGHSSDRKSRGAPRRDDIAPDLYRILGLHPGASDKKINATYRKLAKRLHPDVNASETATERLIEINRAYQILGDPDAREAYDAELALECSEARGRFWRGVAAGVVTFMLTASATSLVALLFMYSPHSRPESGERLAGRKRRGEVSRAQPDHFRRRTARSDLAGSDVADTQAGKPSSTSEPTYQQPVSPHSEIGHVAPREKDQSDEPEFSRSR